MGISHVAFLLGSAFLYLVDASNRHMICKDVENVFDEQGVSPNRPMRPTSGLPGKMGPVGPPGAKGDPGEVDYELLKATIKDLVNTRVESEMAKIHEIISKFNASIREGQKEQENEREVCRKDDVMKYKGKCYWLILHSRPDVNFAQAQSLCAEDGGTPADVIDQRHYNMITNKYFEQETKAKHFWIGMTFDPSTRIGTLTNGAKAVFFKWYSSSWPSSSSSYTGMNIQMNANPSSHHGMFNRDPINSSYGVLCQA